VTHRNAEFAHADRARRLHERLLAQRQCIGADDARGIGDERDRNSDDGVVERGTKRRRHHQGQHQQRHGLKDIDDALDDEIYPAADIAGGQAERDTEKAAEEG
jgi:hypothetical protein